MSTSIYRKIYWRIENVAKEILYRYGKNKSVSKGFTILNNGSKSQWILEFYPNSEPLELYIFKHRVDDTSIDLFKARLYINTADDQLEFIDAIMSKVHDLDQNEGYVFNLFRPAVLFSETSNYLQNESLTFVIEFELHPDNLESTDSVSESNKLLSIADYEKLLINEKLYDFTVVCSDKEEIFIHRVFIALKCPVLMELIEAELAESSRKIILSDISSHTMKNVLRFIYTGTLDKNLVVSSNLLYAAEKFRLNDLKSICISLLNKNINAENVLETLVLANYYGEIVLEENCIEYIKMKLDQLTDMESWGKLCTTLNVKIINSISKDPITINLKGSL